MTIHEALYRPQGEVLMTLCLVLLMLQLALLFAAFRDGRSRRYRLLVCLFTLFGVLLLYLPSLVLVWDINHPDGSGTAPAVLAAFRALPVSALLIYELLTAAILAVLLYDLRRSRKSHPTFESIKETMDLLPAGIAFGQTDGTVVLSNLTMNRLSRALTGKSVADLAALRSAADKGEEKAPTLTLPDGSAVWQLSEEPLETDGEAYVQLTATEITKQAAITKELEEKNEKLRDLHMRLDVYNRQADRIVIAQELLTARMTVHNEVGNVLLESRHYFRDPASFDEARLLQALKNTNTYLLREYEADDSAKDPLSDALELAEAIGVDVSIRGPIPAKEPFRTVLAAAISECASNAIKHADGDALSVEIRSGEGETVFCLESNGKMPDGAIRESGGLASLRALAERHGGEMRTGVSAVFRLTIRFPARSGNGLP